MPRPLSATQAAPDPATLRDEWVSQLTALAADVRTWAERSGWKTRGISRSLKDSVLGEYQAPALLLQRDTVEVILNPVSRFVPGADGAVDLYVMPAYDDIASLYLTGGEWKLHYSFRDATRPDRRHDSKGMDLTEATVCRVLDDLSDHAT